MSRTEVDLLEEDGAAAEANSELAFVKMRFRQPQRDRFPWKDGAYEKCVILALGGEPGGEPGGKGGYLKGENWGCGGRLQRQTQTTCSSRPMSGPCSLTIFANGAKIKVIKGTTEKPTRTVRDILVAFDSCNQTYSSS